MDNYETPEIKSAGEVDALSPVVVLVLAIAMYVAVYIVAGTVVAGAAAVGFVLAGIDCD